MFIFFFSILTVIRLAKWGVNLNSVLEWGFFLSTDVKYIYCILNNCPIIRQNSILCPQRQVQQRTRVQSRLTPNCQTLLFMETQLQPWKLTLGEGAGGVLSVHMQNLNQEIFTILHLNGKKKILNCILTIHRDHFKCCNQCSTLFQFRFTSH